MASDETGVRIEGVNAQHWVLAAPGLVLHEAAFSRGAQVVRDLMGGHRPAFWTSDRYSAQQGHGERHQNLLAHPARDIAYVLEASDGLAPFREPVEHNQHPKPFVWTKPAKDIHAKIDRLPVPSV